MSHSERTHAILSASGSHRWLVCTPSARLEQEFPETTSKYAEEGTLAHELAELYLQKYLGQITKATLNKYKKEHDISQEMLVYVEEYAELAIERINEARARSKDAVVLIEQRLDYSPWVPDGFGTGDLVLIADGILEIVDLKYGKGVPVSAEGNTQMRLYALGALNDFGYLYDIETVRMTIVQPRLDNVSTDEVSAESLLKWAEEYVKPRAEKAMAGEGDLVPGEHCRFCRARFTCRARAEYNLELAKYDFQDPELLSDEEIAEVLARAEELQQWVKDVYAYAHDQAVNHGKKWPGWKLVEGRSNRKYTDKEVVIETLLQHGYKEDQIYEKTLLGVSKMEKLLGKKQFHELLCEFVVKPPGKPTLVPESDKRPEINSAKEDFKEE